MSPKDDFHSFHIRFIQLAYEAKIKENKHGLYMNAKLYLRLRKLVIREFAKEGTFAELVNACSTTAYQLKSIAESEACRRPKAGHETVTGLRARLPTPRRGRSPSTILPRQAWMPEHASNVGRSGTS